MMLEHREERDRPLSRTLVFTQHHAAARPNRKLQQVRASPVASIGEPWRGPTRHDQAFDAIDLDLGA
jgi:hypothetical protein